ncbi:hypothetical protein BCF11_2717 [Collimonas sp. PA-H2]|uniref:hypothetical protein n=1 Tax=Collimonas sp. PA-H2 TaxID=1881062 RepID=UPI000BF50AF6|nr:hypothetical protein [Collimonas sp. PA-H2]PFH10299.1 hypothetical protein BCF11_2717 [Collimonas sp. PA-H2]
MSSIETVPVLRHLSSKLDSCNQQLDGYMQDQANGAQVDGAEFLKMIEQRTVTQQAMEAQLKLKEKPLRTVLSDNH